MVKSTSDAAIKLLITDVDGTLAGANHSIAPRVRKAIALAQERGVHISLCTGRPRIAAHYFVTDLGLDGFHIFDAGATIVNLSSGVTLYHKGLERELAHAIVKAARQANVYLEMYGDGGYFVEQPDDRTVQHVKLQRANFTQINFDDAVDRYAVTKLEAVTRDAAERERAQQLIDRFGNKVDYGWATAPGLSFDFVNILAKGVSKGEAVEKLMAHLGILPVQTMAIGDGANDEPMVRAAGLGVAMGDSPQMLKAVAQWIAPDVTEDGLAIAIERFILS